MILVFLLFLTGSRSWHPVFVIPILMLACQEFGNTLVFTATLACKSPAQVYAGCCASYYIDLACGGVNKR